ncbi:hypothetical protein TNCV_4109951 [Trichonephila clavipes]|nr:hypothetical protein TNCV_4109951 [Trichonephila clavipes]
MVDLLLTSSIPWIFYSGETWKHLCGATVQDLTAKIVVASAALLAHQSCSNASNNPSSVGAMKYAAATWNDYWDNHSPLHF